MRMTTIGWVVAATIIATALPVMAQSTTAPQAAPAVPPGETPSQAARDPQTGINNNVPSSPDQDKPMPPSDPPRSGSDHP